MRREAHGMGITALLNGQIQAGSLVRDDQAGLIGHHQSA